MESDARAALACGNPRVVRAEVWMLARIGARRLVPASATPLKTAPAKARYDAGTPFVQP